MNIVITGASGFVGTTLCQVLLERGDRVTGIGTSSQPKVATARYFQDNLELQERFLWIQADTTKPGAWQQAVKEADVIVNLTGKNIFGYWTEKYKHEIYTSRIMTTRNIIEALPEDGQVVLLNTSAIGYYGDRGDDPLTEVDNPGGDFLARVCVDWEHEAQKATEKGGRVILMRFGVVLGKGGGALGKMLPAFKFLAGGPLGKGLHWFPWIHMDDLIRAILMLIENKEIEGPVNLVSPQLVRHKTFAAALGRALHRPAFMPAPAFMVKAFMGEMGRAFLSSQKAAPAVLASLGFSYRFEDIDSALQNLV